MVISLNINIFIILTTIYVINAIAPYKKPRSSNVPGNLYVDESCIDCDACRWICPNVFNRIGIKSSVIKQPDGESETLQAYSAMIACPVGSIRTRTNDPLVKRALNIFPAEIDSVNIPGIYHMGYHSAESFGATSYLIKINSSNNTIKNVMIDVPRFNSKLANVVEDEGGIDLLVITHRDNIPHQQKWKDRFPKMTRVMHRTDLTSDTMNLEVKLEGGGPWYPYGKESGFNIIHTPGHTAGSLCIYRETKGEYGGDIVLFTGDHLAYSHSRKALEGFKRYNQGNVMVQGEMIKALATDDLPFTWILPSHGRMAKFSSTEEKNELVLKAYKDFMAEDELIGRFSIGYT